MSCDTPQSNGAPVPEALWGLARGAVVGLAVLSSCALPEVKPREPERPAGPLGLEEAVALALRNNPDVERADHLLMVARETVRDAQSHYWPVLEFVERYTRTDVPSQAFASILDQGEFEPTIDFNDPGPVSNFRTGLTGSLTLYDGGRRRAQVEGARARALSASARLEETRRDLSLEVARAYFLVFQTAGTADTQEQSVATLQAHLSLVEALQSEGAARRSEILAVRVRLAETQEAVIVARNSSERARAALHLLLGLGVEEPLELLPPTLGEPAVLDELGPLLGRASRQRQELVAVVADARAAEAALQAAHAGYYPELTLFGSYGLDDANLFQGSPNWSYGVSFLQSLTESLRTPTRVRRAAALLAAAYASVRGEMLRVELDVKNALLDAEEADARHAVSMQTVSLAEESLRQVEAEYESGSATITRLLDAELALSQARTRLGNSDYERCFSRILIEHATGEYPAPAEPPGADGSDPDDEAAPPREEPR